MICCAWCLKRQAELLANIQKLKDLIFKPAFLSSLKESALGTLSSHPQRDSHLEPESRHPMTGLVSLHPAESHLSVSRFLTVLRCERKWSGMKGSEDHMGPQALQSPGFCSSLKMAAQLGTCKIQVWSCHFSVQYHAVLPVHSE